MSLLRKIAASTTLALAASASHAQIYFQDTNTYTFDGYTNPTNQPVAGYAFGGAVYFWTFSAAAPANVPLTLRMTIAGLPVNADTSGFYLEYYDTLASQRRTVTLYPVGSEYTLRNGTYTATLTPNGVTTAALFGPERWDNAYFATITDICIFGPGGCGNGPSSADTTTALHALAVSLKTPFILSKATAENALTYDCDRFDAKKLCFTAIGRRLSGNGTDSSENAGAVMLAYKLSPHWRVGGYVDQVSTSSTTALRVSSEMPLVGVNAVWNARPDGEGLEVRGGVAYRQQSLDITRSVVGTSEAGAGSSQMSSKLASVTAFYNRHLSDAWAIAPYAGVRYYQGQLNSYTESGSDSVTAPLTYANLAERTVTASLGLRSTGRFGKTSGTASIGIDRDITSELDPLSATGVSDISPVSVNGYQRFKTRAVASLSVSRALSERQSMGLTALYRQEAFMGTATTALFAQYRVGF